jgi:predicted nucleic acid-binding protein
VTRVAFDTNILAYAEGVNGEQNRAAALALLRRVPAESAVLPVQTLGELFNVLTRKAARQPAAAREAVLGWQDAFEMAETSAAVVLDALELAVDRHLGIWDAIILAAAARAGCRLLVSEDLQDGFTWRGVTVTNPFSGQPHPLLAALLAAGPEPG